VSFSRDHGSPRPPGEAVEDRAGLATRAGGRLRGWLAGKAACSSDFTLLDQPGRPPFITREGVDTY